ncbi:hypothetical protein SLH49_00115 [Cognatiyoonia sp. IB215446]|uniref:hypothetical protein n=1 Tax=Cognatiyoonia sp. IB215446 TaxID=3097355 RepID=UPI002A0BD1A5|nr:hypothetical protein [Cognatiyoonia sp. IB215446]MDX8346379.1 hypothetical protein [Cognatiyoonia sp. IB215446]
MAEVAVYFVRLFGDENTGSTQMRGHDLFELVEPYMGPNLSARQIVMPTAKHRIAQRIWARVVPRDAIYFLTKRALERIDPEAAHILKSRARAVCFDYVDGDLQRIRSEFADIHVCTSYAQEKAIIRLQLEGQFAPGPTCVILHNASADLTNMKSKPASSFSTAYVGTIAMTEIPEVLQSEVQIIDASSTKDFKKSLNRLSQFSLHYCFRRSKEKSDGIIKPFTKGVTAAMCSSNVITSRKVWDAEALLGSDYPYLTNDNSEEEILQAFEMARSSFGTKTWQDALHAVGQIKELTSGPALAQAFKDMSRIAGVA